jgi:hypothetical protein
MTTRGARTAALWLVAGAVLSTGLSAGADSRDDSRDNPAGDRLDRQIGIFEKVLDDMLIESPNFLVQSRDNAQGTYIDGLGAMFTFRTSLNSRHRGSHWDWLGDTIAHFIVVDEDDHEILSDRDLREREIQEQTRLYADGKDEILEALRDFGGVLTSLGDADRIEIRVRLGGDAYFKENTLRKLTVSVTMGDVRAYMNGDLGAERFADRVSIKES